MWMLTLHQPPEDLQHKLSELRGAIRETAPIAAERISYGLPYYEYKERLAYFRLAKNHIGLYVPPPVMEEHRDEFADYETAKGTVRFPLNQNLPIELIKKLVRDRMKENELKTAKTRHMQRS
jgi:uncharacterized protein YdhG (YjbR/CyaY superfamily)